MIPLKDNIPSSTAPFINYGIIALNCLVFFWELDLGRQLPEMVSALGFVPSRFLTLLGAESRNWPAIVIPTFSAFFLHSGWLHIIANMWFLYIFGDNVEDSLGHGRYLLLYFVCGAGSNLLYLMFAPHSKIPLIGASGAIAGIMGAYFTLFPGARILTLFLVIFIPIFLELPAYFFLGLWLVLQFFYGSLASMQLTAQKGGVAWWAHVGGFLLGFLLLRLLVPHRVGRIFRRL